MGITQIIAGLFEPAAKLIDAVHTSTEEKMTAQAILLDIKAKTLSATLDFELKSLEARADIVNSEAKSEHWLTANWRPLVMLAFTGLIVARFLGYHAEGMSEAEYLELWLIVKLGIGGYVGGRSVEKVVKTIKG